MNFDIGIPKKDSYKFNEVTSITNVKPYVLRFWETEFEGINPTYLEDGSKIYKQEDIELIEKIKDLLFTDKMSIPEAKFKLEKSEEAIDSLSVTPLAEQSKDLKDALENIIVSHTDPQVIKTSNLTQQFKESGLNDQDILSLVTAKKKLTNVLGRIDHIVESRNW